MRLRLHLLLRHFHFLFNNVRDGIADWQLVRLCETRLLSKVNVDTKAINNLPFCVIIACGSPQCAVNLLQLHSTACYCHHAVPVLMMKVQTEKPQKMLKPFNCSQSCSNWVCDKLHAQRLRLTEHFIGWLELRVCLMSWPASSDESLTPLIKWPMWQTIASRLLSCSWCHWSPQPDIENHSPAFFFFNFSTGNFILPLTAVEQTIRKLIRWSNNVINAAASKQEGKFQPRNVIGKSEQSYHCREWNWDETKSFCCIWSTSLVSNRLRLETSFHFLAFLVHRRMVQLQLWVVA